MPANVYLLTGYLGSGKTTLLQKWLTHLRVQNENVVVLMNEMGEEDIDGEQLQGFGFPVKKLLDGCICCSIKGELTEGLRDILNSLQPDRILIETTGVADPIDVIDTLTHPELYDRIELKGTISVVDASRFLDLNSRFASTAALVKTIRNQVKYADLILLNKTDMASAELVERVKQKLAELNPKAPIHQAVQANIDLSRLQAVKRVEHVREPDSASPAPVQTTIGRMSTMDRLKQSLGLKTSTPSLYNSIDTFSYTFTG